MNGAGSGLVKPPSMVVLFKQNVYVGVAKKFGKWTVQMPT